jgi:hypothetical protein
VTIDQLPDDVLLDIFDFYLFYLAYPLPPPFHEEDEWHTLVHVCRRWRYVVFGSPRRLDLSLICTNRRLGKTLDIWPELPIVIHVDEQIYPLPSVANIISVLNRHDRVCKIVFADFPDSFWKEVVTTMSEPFPALIELELAAFERGPPILPDSFLGGSAPRLRSLDLRGIRFPEIGKLLLSTRDLVSLSLDFIPPSGYISPEAIFPILSALTKLKSLRFRFKIPFSTHGASQRPPALTRVVLPALTEFSFYGSSGYLVDILSRIDAPLDCIIATFPHNIVVSDIPLLRDFIYRKKILNAPHRAEIHFSNFDSIISLFQRKGDVDFQVLSLAIPCSYYALSSLISSLAQLFPPLPSLEHLGIYKYRSDDNSSMWHRKVDTTLWTELLRLYITVKDLVLDELFVLSLAPTLQELGEQGTEILPALQNIFIEGFQSSGQVPGGIAKFIAARERSGRPVIVHHREAKQ